MPIPSMVNPLHLRRVMGRKRWAPPRPYGPSGWRMLAFRHDEIAPIGTIVVTVSEVPGYAEETGDFTDWCHASFSWVDRVPTYDELMLLKSAVWPNGEAYQIHPAEEAHVNIHPFALHLWGRADGARVLPDMGRFGTI